jgi:hypothetical protein
VLNHISDSQVTLPGNKRKRVKELILFLCAVILAEHVARRGRRGMRIGYWWESQKERDQREDQDVGGWTVLEWILEVWIG